MLERMMFPSRAKRYVQRNLIEVHKRHHVPQTNFTAELRVINFAQESRKEERNISALPLEP